MGLFFAKKKFEDFMVTTKDEFVYSALRLLISIVSLVIMIPLFDDISLYITALVFSLGKLIDVLEKLISQRQKSLFVVNVIMIFVAIIGISMSFYVLSGGIAQSNTIYNIMLLVLNSVFCVFEIICFVHYICKLYYTKKALSHF